MGRKLENNLYSFLTQPKKWGRESVKGQAKSSAVWPEKENIITLTLLETSQTEQNQRQDSCKRTSLKNIFIKNFNSSLRRAEKEQFPQPGRLARRHSDGHKLELLLESNSPSETKRKTSRGYDSLCLEKKTSRGYDSVFLEKPASARSDRRRSDAIVSMRAPASCIGFDRSEKISDDMLDFTGDSANSRGSRRDSHLENPEFDWLSYYRACTKAEKSRRHSLDEIRPDLDLESESDGSGDFVLLPTEDSPKQQSPKSPLYASKTLSSACELQLREAQTSPAKQLEQEEMVQEPVAMAVQLTKESVSDRVMASPSSKKVMALHGSFKGRRWRPSLDAISEAESMAIMNEIQSRLGGRAKQRFQRSKQPKV